jgi:hypothetical protein
LGAFVVLVTFQIHGVRSQLSVGKPGQAMVSQEDEIVIEIGNLDQIVVNGFERSFDDTIREIQSQGPLSRIYIAPEPNASYGLGLRLKTELTSMPDLEVVELYRPTSK